MVKRGIVYTLVFSMIFLYISTSVSALPFGASGTKVSSERRAIDAPVTDQAYAGNVTLINFNGRTITQAWQGYYGNISGTIELADANNRSIYNWTNAKPQGEVYASNNSVTWTNIQCFNYTALGTFASDAGQVGTTSLFGMNLSQLSATFGIQGDDPDGVNNTFYDTTSHDLFFTNSQQFSSGECLATNLYDSTGAAQAANFQETILYDPDGRHPVWASIIENDVNGFDASTHDFEMIVLENGHGTDIASTTYYFYVELE